MLDSLELTIKLEDSSRAVCVRTRSPWQHGKKRSLGLRRDLGGWLEDVESVDGGAEDCARDLRVPVQLLHVVLALEEKRIRGTTIGVTRGRETAAPQTERARRTQNREREREREESVRERKGEGKCSVLEGRRKTERDGERVGEREKREITDRERMPCGRRGAAGAAPGPPPSRPSPPPCRAPATDPTP